MIWLYWGLLGYGLVWEKILRVWEKIFLFFLFFGMHWYLICEILCSAYSKLFNPSFTEVEISLHIQALCLHRESCLGSLRAGITISIFQWGSQSPIFQFENKSLDIQIFWSCQIGSLGVLSSQVHLFWKGRLSSVIQRGMLPIYRLFVQVLLRIGS